MLRSVLLTLALVGTCAAHPPASSERLVKQGVSKFVTRVERRRMIEEIDRAISQLNDSVKSRAEKLQTCSPEHVPFLEADLARMLRLLALVKQHRQELLNQEAKDPMPRPKRTN